MADINDIKIENLLDLSKTDAASLFDGKAFPFEVLPEIKSYILNVLIPSLDKNEFEQAGENVWIAKTAKVAPSALINGPTVIFPEAEIRQNGNEYSLQKQQKRISHQQSHDRGRGGGMEM